MDLGKTFWEDIINAADTLIVVLDAHGKIKFLNRKALKLCGYGEEEVLARFWLDTFVPAKHQAKFQRVLTSLREGRNIARYSEYPILSREGREIPIAWDRTIIKDRDSRNPSIFSVGHDLTLARIVAGERRTSP